MKNLLITLMLITLTISLNGCDIGSTTDDIQKNQTEKMLSDANRQIGMPSIVNFQERKLAKLILELRDQENLITYAYIANLNGDLIFIGKCIGYGIPYSTQFTNPQKIVSGYRSSIISMPQADPNGLFMPSSSSATWLMMMDDTGEARPVYIEPKIIVSPFKLK